MEELTLFPPVPGWAARAARAVWPQAVWVILLLMEIPDTAVSRWPQLRQPVEKGHLDQWVALPFQQLLKATEQPAESLALAVRVVAYFQAGRVWPAVLEQMV